VAEIIQFVTRAERAEEAGEVDLLTAVDAAIRDLSDILARWGEDTSREQAEDCRRMLEQAFNAAV
jgi:hypothetical protein